MSKPYYTDNKTQTIIKGIEKHNDSSTIQIDTKGHMYFRSQPVFIEQTNSGCLSCLHKY